MPYVTTVSHVSLGTTDYPRAKAFYDAVLGTLGITCVMEEAPFAAGYGRKFPEFWIQLPFDGAAASVGNGTHVCFTAQSPEQVKAFYAKALELGGKDDGPPGFRPQYMPNYYAAFARDPDGNKIEAMCLADPPAA